MTKIRTNSKHELVGKLIGNSAQMVATREYFTKRTDSILRSLENKTEYITADEAVKKGEITILGKRVSKKGTLLVTWCYSVNIESKTEEPEHRFTARKYLP